MTLRLFALRLLGGILDYIADRSVRASLRMSQAIHAARHEYLSAANPGRRMRPCLIVRGGAVYIMHADGRVEFARALEPGSRLRVQRGGVA